ncbi:hypothetical protein CR105_03135 [Massilia eurypsychrophila]|uniref:HipA-like kinase domain-containing protein n=1 Tax=Massilia eurypsychrophila TaxID=1485217 RepID=A0A2G8TJ79_9BURK|nr:HipA family kinase [Massilia eurypsychrophila]PIL46100.1 hypothetical protein CR105_03135 [Massilia eurypsychrophila]
MLRTVTATRFIKRMGNGRTWPCLIECEDEEGNKFELVVKYSEKLFEREKNLAFEAIAAMLAADLCLPVPEPFVVQIEEDFIEIVPDREVKAALQSSCRTAFGSRLVTGFSAWQNGQTIPRSMVTAATEICVFDQIIENSDRIPKNPNCQFLANDFLIYDHELAFTRVLFWREPWAEGGLDSIARRDEHIFSKPHLSEAPGNLDRFIGCWEDLQEDRFEQYRNAIPPEWLQKREHAEQVDRIFAYLSEAKANIRKIAENALEVLK